MKRSHALKISSSPLRRRLLRMAGLFVLICRVSLSSSVLAQDASQPPAESPSETSAPESSQQLILVIGAPGTEEYATNFNTWASRWEMAAQRAGITCTVIGKNHSVPSASVTPAGSSEPLPAPASEPEETDVASLVKAIEQLSSSKSSEPLWIVFLGHGTFDGRTASWNLHGPDITAEDL